MKAKANIRDQFVLSLTRLANKYGVLSKIPIDFGTGEKLTAAEIHSIAAIGRHDAITVTELASYFGITLGAVSQMIRKLENKGYIAKTRHPEYWKEILLSLTDKGQTAFKGHEALHADMDSGILEEIERSDPDQLEVCLDLMHKIEQQIEQYIERRR